MPGSFLAVPISRGAFRSFGQVLSADETSGRAANQGSAVRADFAANLVSSRAQARPNAAVFRSQPRQLPFSIELLERHPSSSQLFVPMTVRRYVVVVATSLPTGQPDEAQLKAFIVGDGTAINYDAGVWHHPLIVLDHPADFVMIAWEDGSSGDTEEVRLAEPRTLVVQ